MRIGIDFDGTIANTTVLKSLWIERRLGQKVGPHLCDRTCYVPIVGVKAYDELSLEVYGDATTARLCPLPGVLAAISELREKHDVIGVSTEEMSKGEACRRNNVDCLIDDDERHLYAAAKLGARVILLKEGAPETFDREYIQVCRSWSEVVGILC